MHKTDLCPYTRPGKTFSHISEQLTELFDRKPRWFKSRQQKDVKVNRHFATHKHKHDERVNHAFMIAHVVP